MSIREILFHGKRIDNGEWVEGWYVPAVEYESLIHRGEIVKFGEAISYKTQKGFLDDDAVIPETIRQFTGLYDKNCKKIFEDDIVEYNDGFYYFKGRIVFIAGAFGIYCKDTIPLEIPDTCHNDNFISLWEIGWNQEDPDLNSLDYVCVIGNIHDNPELLEVKN